MTQCFKDKDRRCDEECEAYCSSERHGTNCLELATRVETGERIGQLKIAYDLNSLFLHVLSQSMESFKDLAEKAFKAFR